MKTNNNFIYKWLNIFIPLVLGSVIYLLLANNTIINDLTGINTFINITSHSILGVLRFYIVDALWAYSLTFSLSLFCKNNTAAIIAFSSGLAWETLQRTSYVAGTCDYIDICMYFMASLIALMILNKKEHIK